MKKTGAVVLAFLLVSLPALNNAVAVTECGSLAAGGDYVLAADVAAPGGGDCFVAAGDGVSLDCAGFRVVGSGGSGAGFKNPGFGDVVIHGCVVQGFAVGVSFEGTAPFSGGAITANTVSGSPASLKVSGAASLSISQNSFSAPVDVSSSSGLVFSSNTLNSAESGALRLNGVSASSFSDNAVSSGGGYALRLSSGSQGNSFNGGSFASGAGADALIDSSPSNSFVETSFFHSNAALAGESGGASFKDCGLSAAGLRWVSGNARVVIKNSARVRVVDANETLVSGALVSASSAGNSFFEGESGVGGVTPWFDVVAFDGNSGGGSTQSPFEARAVKNGVAGSVSGVVASPKREVVVALGLFSTPTPSIVPSPSASPNASVAPNASLAPSATASQKPWFDLPFFGGDTEESASPSAFVVPRESPLPVGNAGRGVGAAEPGAEVPDYALPSPSASPTPACAWCGVTQAVPWWVWVAAAFVVAALVWRWRKNRFSTG